MPMSTSTQFLHFPMPISSNEFKTFKFQFQHQCSDYCNQASEGFGKACQSSPDEVNLLEQIAMKMERMDTEIRDLNEKIESQGRKIESQDLKILSLFKLNQDSWVGSLVIHLNQKIREFEDGFIRPRISREVLRGLDKNISLIRFMDLPSDELEKVLKDPNVKKVYDF